MICKKAKARNNAIHGKLNSKGMSNLSPLGSGMEGRAFVTFGTFNPHNLGQSGSVCMTIEEFDELAAYVAETRGTYGA